MAGALERVGVQALGARARREPHGVADLVHQLERAAGPVAEDDQAEGVRAHVDHGQAAFRAASAGGANLGAMAPTPLRPPAISDVGDGGPSSAEGRAWPGTFDAPETVERVWTDFVAALPGSRPADRPAPGAGLRPRPPRHAVPPRQRRRPYWVHLVRVAMELAGWGEALAGAAAGGAAARHGGGHAHDDRRDPGRLRCRGRRPRRLAHRPRRAGRAARLLRAAAHQRAVRGPGAEDRRPRGQPAQHPGPRDAHRRALPPLGRHLPAPHRPGRCCRWPPAPHRWPAWPWSRRWPTSPRWSTTAASPTPNVARNPADTGGGLDAAMHSPSDLQGDTMTVHLTLAEIARIEELLSRLDPAPVRRLPGPRLPARARHVPARRASRRSPRSASSAPPSRAACSIRSRRPPRRAGLSSRRRPAGTSSTGQGALWATCPAKLPSSDRSTRPAVRRRRRSGRSRPRGPTRTAVAARVALQQDGLGPLDLADLLREPHPGRLALQGGVGHRPAAEARRERDEVAGGGHDVDDAQARRRSGRAAPPRARGPRGPPPTRR